MIIILDTLKLAHLGVQFLQQFSSGIIGKIRLYNWEYFLYTNERKKEEETIMTPQKDHYSQKHLTTRERASERNCSNMTIIGKETNFHHFYSISFLILSHKVHF